MLWVARSSALAWPRRAITTTRDRGDADTFRYAPTTGVDMCFGGPPPGARSANNRQRYPADLGSRWLGSLRRAVLCVRRASARLTARQCGNGSSLRSSLLTYGCHDTTGQHEPASWGARVPRNQPPISSRPPTAPTPGDNDGTLSTLRSLRSRLGRTCADRNLVRGEAGSSLEATAEVEERG
jgi:hypothetical protein